jgi:hypothetical protein
LTHLRVGRLIEAMRIAALLVAVAGCTPAATHLSAKVTIELSSDDPSAAVVKLEAYAYEATGQDDDTSQSVSGIDARIELDGRVVPLSEDEPGHHAGEVQQGFPQSIRLLGDDEAVELGHSPFSTAIVDRTDEYLRVAIDPPVQPDEWVVVIRSATDGVTSQPIYGEAVEFPPGFAKLTLTRSFTADDDSEGLRLGGQVIVRRAPPVPHFGGDP